MDFQSSQNIELEQIILEAKRCLKNNGVYIGFPTSWFVKKYFDKQEFFEGYSGIFRNI